MRREVYANKNDDEEYSFPSRHRNQWRSDPPASVEIVKKVSDHINILVSPPSGGTRTHLLESPSRRRSIVVVPERHRRREGG